MALARVHDPLSVALVRRLGDAGGPRGDQVADELDNIIAATIPWSYTWFFPDPDAAAIAEDTPTLLIPAQATDFIVTHLRVIYRQGSHTAGGSVTFTLRRRGSVSADLGTISLNDTNNAANTLFTNNITDTPVNPSDQLFIFKSAESGTVSERSASLFAEGTMRLS